MWLFSCSFFHAPFSTLYVSIIFAILITVCLGVVGFSCGSADKEAACNEGDLGSIPELGRSLGEWKGYLLQYSGLENSVDCYSPWGHKESGRPSDFNFHFGVVLFGFILFGALCVSWNWMSIFLPRLGKFQLSSLQVCFLPLFLSLAPSGILIRRTLEHLVLAETSLKLSSSLFILFFCFTECFPLFCLPTHWSIPLYHLFYC